MTGIPEIDLGDWEARITRLGRWTWHIAPVKGITGLREGYIAIGTAARAERVARRKLAKLWTQDQRDANSTMIR